MKVVLTIVTALVISAPASAAGFECVAKASASGPRTRPLAASGFGPTLASAEKNAKSSCESLNGNFTAGCVVSRCNAN